MEILIIGGSRFVGPLLVKQLLAKKHKVTLFNRGLEQSNYRGVSFIQGDREQGFNLQKSFDVVIDMCAFDGAQTEAAVEQLDFKFFVHMGTAAAYKKTNIFPLKEEGSALGEWPLWGGYNAGKVECERVLSRKKIRFASIRPVYILGPKNYCDRERFIYSRIKQGIPLIIPGDGESIVQFVFVQDVAHSIALLAEKKVCGAFNCAGDELITLRGLVEEMGKVMGRAPVYRFNPDRDGDKFDDREFPFANENYICSNGKIKSLGVKFTSLLTGLAKDYRNYYSRII